MYRAVLALAVALVVGLGTVVPARADQLAPDDLARKNDGGYVTGLPLFAYSTDLGLGLGARAYYYWNGHAGDPRFATTPYLYRVFVQAFASTGGTQFHWLDFDAPRIFASPYRVRAQVIIQRNTNSNYFGLGERALAPLRVPGQAATFDRYDDYAAALRQITGGTTDAKYDQYDLVRPLVIASVERLVLDDRVRLLAGLGASYARIRDYTGRDVDAGPDSDLTAEQDPTRLALDCAAGRLAGCGGGRDNFVRLGASYDTRDFEPDPNRGAFVDVALDAGTLALGSEYDYVRFLVAARGYWRPFGADLVLAGRAVFEAQSNGAPFFSMNTLPFTDDPRAGLGGHRTLRGYRQDRFVGSVMTLVNAELRWTFAHAQLAGQRFGFIVAPFLDAGRPYDALDDLTARRWRTSYGGALRIAWNLATLITIDYGRSTEDAGLYINFNHIF